MRWKSGGKAPNDPSNCFRQRNKKVQRPRGMNEFGMFEEQQDQWTHVKSAVGKMP